MKTSDLDDFYRLPPVSQGKIYDHYMALMAFECQHIVNQSEPNHGMKNSCIQPIQHWLWWNTNPQRKEEKPP